MARLQRMLAVALACLPLSLAAAAPQQPVPPGRVESPEPPPPLIDQAPPDRFAPPIERPSDKRPDYLPKADADEERSFPDNERDKLKNDKAK